MSEERDEARLELRPIHAALLRFCAGSDVTHRRDTSTNISMNIHCRTRLRSEELEARTPATGSERRQRLDGLVFKIG